MANGPTSASAHRRFASEAGKISTSRAMTVEWVRWTPSWRRRTKSATDIAIAHTTVHVRWAHGCAPKSPYLTGQ